MVKHIVARVNRITLTPHWDDAKRVTELVELDATSDKLNELWSTDGAPHAGLKIAVTDPKALGSFRIGQAFLLSIQPLEK